MRHAVMVSLVAMRSIPKRNRHVVPRATRRVAAWVLAYLDRRRRLIDEQATG